MGNIRFLLKKIGGMPRSPEKSDRKNKTGMKGGPKDAKKGGKGGKYTWGGLDVQDGPAVLDKGDPNYDPDEPKK